MLSKYLFLPSLWAHSSEKTSFWSWILKTLSKFREKRKSLSCVFPSTRRKIEHFHVVVMQWWQRNVQKSEMHVQSCCETYCFFFHIQSSKFLSNDQTQLWNVIFINHRQCWHVCPCESHAITCAWAAVRPRWGFPHTVLNKNECSRALNASYMFQTPYKSLHIHTQKRKQLPSIPWRTSTQRKAVDTHKQRKKQLPCTHKRTIGYHADTVNKQLPSSYREKSSCHIPTHAQAYTNYTPRRTNREKQAYNIHTEKQLS